MIRVCVLVAFLALGVHGQGSEEDAARWANVYNIQAEILWYESTEADWTYNTNLTDYNMEKSVSKAGQLTDASVY